MARRTASGRSGIVLVDKPAGMTSHDVVDRVRRVYSERRVGHAGTLDPMATGLLVVCVGPATRLATYLTAASKEYEATVVFGYETDTDDACGQQTAVAPVPHEVSDPFAATGFVSSLVGVHRQVPPAYSAVKREGVAAYERARKGEDVELDARTVEVEAAVLTGLSVDPVVTWDVRLRVSKGTYIRSLARDIGRAMSTAAHLGALRRVSSGGLTVHDAVTLQDLADIPDPERRFADPAVALALPVVVIDPERTKDLYDGKTLSIVVDLPEGALVSVVCEDGLLSVHRVTPSGLRPETVIPGGVSGVHTR